MNRGKFENNGDVIPPEPNIVVGPYVPTAELVRNSLPTRAMDLLYSAGCSTT